MALSPRELISRILASRNFLWVIERLLEAKDFDLRTTQILINVDPDGDFAGVEFHPSEVCPKDADPFEWAKSTVDAMKTRGYRNTSVEIRIDGQGRPSLSRYRFYKQYQKG